MIPAGDTQPARELSHRSQSQGLPGTRQGRAGERRTPTSSSQELLALLRPQLLPVPCEAMKLRRRSISSDRWACSS